MRTAIAAVSAGSFESGKMGSKINRRIVAAGCADACEPTAPCQQIERETYVVDDLCNPNNSLAAWSGHQHHDGWFDSYPAGHRDHHGPRQRHFWPQVRAPAPIKHSLNLAGLTSDQPGTGGDKARRYGILETRPSTANYELSK